VGFAGSVQAAREINAQEQPLEGAAKLENGELVTSFSPFQPRTFALTLNKATARLEAVQSQPVELHYDLAVASNDDTKTEGGGFDGKGDAMPAEMLRAKIGYDDVQFDLAPAKTGVANAVVAKGQTIDLPAGHFNRIYILAAAEDGDQTAAFGVGDKKVDLKIQDWSGFIGQWDNRVWRNQPERSWAISAAHAVWPASDEQERERRPPSPRYPEDYVGLEAGYIKTTGLAWYASHQHTSDGLNQPYRCSYLFAYPIDISDSDRTLVLPDNNKIRILAVSVAHENPEMNSAQPLYDTLNASEPSGKLEDMPRSVAVDKE
jgi:alpha-mannosidase